MGYLVRFSEIIEGLLEDKKYSPVGEDGDYYIMLTEVGHGPGYGRIAVCMHWLDDGEIEELVLEPDDLTGEWVEVDSVTTN